MKQLLVCLDLAPSSRRVLERGAELALALGAEVHLLHVAAPEPTFVGYDPKGGPYDRDRRAHELKDEHAELGRLVAELRERGVTATPLLVVGMTVETILDQAERLEADLVVIGSHGHRALHRYLIGSTADALVRRCPQLLVLVPCHDD
jgi:nucleotide-binding universal stress UspA family protein